MSRIQNRVAIVTGGTQGVGEAIAALLASDEACFIIGENIVIDGCVSVRMYD